EGISNWPEMTVASPQKSPQLKRAERKVFPRGWWTARTGPVSADQSIRWALFSPESWGCPPVPTTRWAIGQLNRAAQAALRSLPSSYANFFILTAPLPPEESA